MATPGHRHVFIVFLCLLLFFSLTSAAGSKWAPLFAGEDDVQLASLVTTKCPQIATVNYLRTADGRQQTVRGNRLQVITFGYHPTQHRLGVAEVRLTANIHGNEVAGRMVLAHFIKIICLLWERKQTSHPKFERFFRYLSKTRIHILMSANPDGYDTFVEAYRRNASAADKLYLLGRNNANNLDLNRNFFVDPSLQKADQHTQLRYPTEKMFRPPSRPSWRQEIETQMIQQWMASVDFVLAASFHGGQRLASVPFDAQDTTGSGRKSSPSSQFGVSFDIAKVYMKKFAYTGCGYKNEPLLDTGVINGAAWYPFIGSMGDYSYLMTNCLEVTIEMYCMKYPRPTYYQHFQKAVMWQVYALMDFLLTAHWGIKGVVRSSKDHKAIPNALIFAMDLKAEARFAQKPTVAGQNGEFFRLLRNGRHVILVAKQGFAQQLMCINVQNNQLRSTAMQEAQIFNFELKETSFPTAQLLSGCLPNEMMNILNAYRHWSGYQLPWFFVKEH